MVLRYKDIDAFDNNKTMKIIYSMYRACCERATQPYSPEGEVRFIQAQDQQVLPHVVENGNRVFTHSLDVN